MSQATTEQVPAGRPVRLVPTPRGFWMTILGGCIAALAPLLGFLIGTMLGRPNGDVALDPLYWGLFGGVIIGGIGVLVAVLGGVQLWRSTRQVDTPAEPVA